MLTCTLQQYILSTRDELDNGDLQKVAPLTELAHGAFCDALLRPVKDNAAKLIGRYCEAVLWGFRGERSSNEYLLPSYCWCCRSLFAGKAREVSLICNKWTTLRPWSLLGLEFLPIQLFVT